MLTRSHCGSEGWACCLCRITRVRTRSSSILLAASSRRLCNHGLAASGGAHLNSQCRQASIACSASRYCAGSSQHSPVNWWVSSGGRHSGSPAVSAAVYDTWFDIWEESDDEHAADDGDDTSSTQSTQQPSAYNATFQLQQQQHHHYHHQQQQQLHGHRYHILSHEDLFQQGHHQLLQQQHVNPQAAAAVTDANFSVKHEVDYGQMLRVVGSAAPLGSWDPSKGPDMSWNKHHRWSVAVPLPAGQHEFKFVLVHRSGWLEWEPGSNRMVDVRPAVSQLQIQGRWGKTQDTNVLELGDQQQQQLLLQQQPSATWAPAQQPQLQPHSQQQQGTVMPVVDTAASQPQHAAAAACWAGRVGHLQDQQQSVAPQMIGPPAGPPATRCMQPTPAADAGLPGQHAAPMNGRSHSAPAARFPSIPTVTGTASEPAGGLLSDVPSAFSSSQQQLVQQLAAQRQELSSSITDIAAGVKEMEAELSLVHDELAHITAERVLQQQQDKIDAEAALNSSSPAAAGSAPDSDDSVWSGLVSEALAKASKISKDNTSLQQELASQQQALTHQLDLLAGRSGRSSSSQLHGMPGNSSSNEVLWRSGHDPLLSAEDAELLAELDRLAGRTSSSSSSNVIQNSWAGNIDSAAGQRHGSIDRSNGVLDNMLAAHQGKVQNDMTGAFSNTISSSGGGGAECAVLSWRQELLSFRHDALLLQDELAAVDGALSGAHQQLAVNRAALHMQNGHQQEGPGGGGGGGAAAAGLAAPTASKSAVGGMPNTQSAAAAPSSSRGRAHSTRARSHGSASASQWYQGTTEGDNNSSSSSHVRHHHHRHHQHLGTEPVKPVKPVGPVNDRPGYKTAAARDTIGNDMPVDTGSKVAAVNSSGSSNGSGVGSSSRVGKKGPAAVAGNVAEYQRLLLQRFNELANQIAADLACSVELLNEDAQQQQQQMQQQQHLQQGHQEQPSQQQQPNQQQHEQPSQQLQQPPSQQQPGDAASAKFAAAHHAAAAAYASGRTQTGDLI